MRLHKLLFIHSRRFVYGALEAGGCPRPVGPGRAMHTPGRSFNMVTLEWNAIQGHRVLIQLRSLGLAGRPLEEDFVFFFLSHFLFIRFAFLSLFSCLVLVRFFLRFYVLFCFCLSVWLYWTVTFVVVYRIVTLRGWREGETYARQRRERKLCVCVRACLRACVRVCVYIHIPSYFPVRQLLLPESPPPGD